MNERAQNRTGDICAWPIVSAFREHKAFIVAGLAAAAVSVAVVPGLGGIFGGGLALLMFAIAQYDLRYFIIPNELTAAAFVLGLANAAIGTLEPAAAAGAFAAVRGIVLGLIFLGIRQAYTLLRAREGLGLGDVKLACVAGVWLGWAMIPVAVEFAALAALLAYLLRRICLFRPVRMVSRVPFGLFFAPAIWLSWFLFSVWPVRIFQ